MSVHEILKHANNARKQPKFPKTDQKSLFNKRLVNHVSHGKATFDEHGLQHFDPTTAGLHQVMLSICCAPLQEASCLLVIGAIRSSL